jgi:hypothetical protein
VGWLADLSCVDPVVDANSMKALAIFLSAASALALVPSQASSMTLDEACARFASKLQTAVAAGNTSQAQMIYSEGSQMVATNFNGATCPNVKAP